MVRTGARARVAALAMLTALARPAAGGEPVVGVQVGTALPTGTTQRMVDPGGAVAPYAGYRWGDSFGLAVVAQPQMVVMPSNKVVRQHDDDLTSLFSFTAGPRFSYANEHTELFLSAQGGVYTPTSGTLGSSAAGFNLGIGLNFRLSDATTAGLFIRRDEPSIKVKVPGRNDDRNVQFLVAGFDLQHRFLAAPPAPEPVEAPPPPPPPPAPPVKQKLVLRGVGFDTDKAAIRPDAQPILDEAARALASDTAVQVAVEGHTDSRGTEEHNQKLSERRAAAVRDYLVDKGVAATRLHAAGMGESKPVAGNDTPEGMAQNRRVELRVTGGE